MKNALNTIDRNELVERINSIEGNEKALWGKMNVSEMICHSSDQIRLATGEIQSVFQGNLFSSSILKILVLAGIPTPKGKVDTFSQLKQGEGGSPPKDFDTDKKTFINLLETFQNSFEPGQKVIHPAFSHLTLTQWGRLIFLHVNYHLSQFGR